jgi:NAD(P)-dependent dehydrogenase (short-subunit alcohol dehydrogenase family)
MLDEAGQKVEVLSEHMAGLDFYLNPSMVHSGSAGTHSRPAERRNLGVGVAKAALESAVRYIAAELGPKGIFVTTAAKIESNGHAALITIFLCPLLAFRLSEARSISDTARHGPPFYILDGIYGSHRNAFVFFMIVPTTYSSGAPRRVASMSVDCFEASS